MTGDPAALPGVKLAALARQIFSDSISGCSIEQAFSSRFASADDDRPHAFSLRGAPGEPTAEVDLAGVSRLFVLAVGKCSAAMLDGLLRRVRVPESCVVATLLIAPSRPEQLPAGVRFFAGGHPLPNRESLRGAQAALQLVRDAASAAAQQKTFFFFLISGGASAMMELPLDASISLEDTVSFHQALVHRGASIQEINCIRKHFSAIKGGRLGLLAKAVPNLTLLVSDVPAGTLDALASGPTVPDSTTVAECREVIERLRLFESFPPKVSSFFQSPDLPETPKPGAFCAKTITLLAEADLARAAQLAAEQQGFIAVVDNTPDNWDYRDAAEYLIARLREVRKWHRRVCLISVGEVAVEVSERKGGPPAGCGGRNQHFALHAATLLQAEDGQIAILSAGSDGVDGNSSFAGAVVDLELFPPDRFKAAASALEQFDSATFLHQAGATIKTGPTGNNLRDLRLLLSVDEEGVSV